MADNNNNNEGNEIPDAMRTFIQDSLNQFGQQLTAQLQTRNNTGTLPNLDEHLNAIKSLKKKIANLEAKNSEAKDQKDIDDFASAKSFNLATLKAKYIILFPLEARVCQLKKLLLGCTILFSLLRPHRLVLFHLELQAFS